MTLEDAAVGRLTQAKAIFYPLPTIETESRPQLRDSDFTRK
jgi:hypothetical protein